MLIQEERENLRKAEQKLKYLQNYYIQNIITYERNRIQICINFYQDIVNHHKHNIEFLKSIKRDYIMLNSI